MTTLLKSAAAAAVLALFAGGAAKAGVLYTNGPISGNVGALFINHGVAVRDSFTLTGPSTITGVEFGAWVNQGAKPVSVDWGISATPTFTDQATGALSSTFLFTNIFTLDVYKADFSIPDLTLAAGTYWLTLQNAVESDGGFLSWDQNSGSSQAFSSAAGGLTAPSNSFTIFGSAVPEPATWAMMLLGVAGLGAALRSRRSVPLAA
jgi:hypothetical protein